MNWQNLNLACGNFTYEPEKKMMLLNLLIGGKSVATKEVSGIKIIK